LVEVVEGFDASATVSKDGMSASGDSIMGLLMLAAPLGSFIDVETSGSDAVALMQAIKALLADKFGEGA
jgi:phosphocarrier protein